MKLISLVVVLLFMSGCSFLGIIEEDVAKDPQLIPNIESLGKEICKDVL